MLTDSNIIIFAKRFIRIITFRDLPLRKKFLLFSAGSLFWLALVAAIGLTFMFYMDSSSKKMVQVNVPHSKAVNIILRKVRGISISVHKIVISEDKLVVEKNHDAASGRIKDCRYYLSALMSGGSIKDISRGTERLGADFFVTPVEHDYERKLIEQLSKKTDVLQKLVDDIANAKIKSPFSMGAAVKDKLAEYDKASLEFEAVIGELLSSIDKEWNMFSGYTSHRIKIAIFIMSFIFLLAFMLYGVFGVLISHALKKPITEIINQIKSLSAGEVDLTKKLEVSSQDELGILSNEFNKLMDTISHVSHFKKIAEEDETTEDVYDRLGKVFKEDLGLESFLIHEVSNSKKSMRIAYPPEMEGTETNCSMDIQLDCELCRAKRTGHIVSSIEFPDICKYFLHGAANSHICVPIIISGNVGGIVQFLCGGEQECGLDFQNKISRAKQYIREIQPVIEAKRLMRTLKESAVKDALTGLYNRRFLEESYESIVAGLQRRGTTLGLLMCDLDFFKNTNDVYGHDVGDMVLKETSSVIRKNVRSADFVIRFGGEEFIVLLMDIKPDEAVQVAEKIRAKVEETKVAITGAIIQKTISIGVSEFPKDTQNFWECIKFADVALYKAKERGRNRVIRFTSDMWGEEKY